MQRVTSKMADIEQRGWPVLSDLSADCRPVHSGVAV